MNDRAATLARRLAEARRGRGLSQRQAGVELGVTQTCLSLAECGRRGVSVGLLVDLAELYQVSVDWLLGLADRPAGG